jgi:hypothetical protein
LQFDQLKARIRSLPQVAAWPQMLERIDNAVHRDLRCVWDFPIVACQAVGGTAAAALPGAAAILCSLIGIHLTTCSTTTRAAISGGSAPVQPPTSPLRSRLPDMALSTLPRSRPRCGPSSTLASPG